MSCIADKEEMMKAYMDVRDDNSPTMWAVFKYEGNKVVLTKTGIDYPEFLSYLAPDERVYGFVRFETGDEMSKRAKFALITWVGASVGALKKAKVSTDKAFVKEVIVNFAKEILADNLDEVEYEHVKAQLIAVGGANYGTGVRAK